MRIPMKAVTSTVTVGLPAFGAVAGSTGQFVNNGDCMTATVGGGGVRRRGPSAAGAAPGGDSPVGQATACASISLSVLTTGSIFLSVLTIETRQIGLKSGQNR